MGVKIHLHVFVYERATSDELLKYCETVQYYKRKNKFLTALHYIPQMTFSRRNSLLVANLKKDNYPILLEGFQSSYILNLNDFSERITLLRVHNIEQNYYRGLAKSEQNWLKKIYYKIETFKLKIYEKTIIKVSHILTISPFETAYFNEKYNIKAHYIPVFHKYDTVKILSSKGKHILYHGDLRIADNIKACLFLIDVFKTLNYTLNIASSTNNELVLNKVKAQKNINFISISTDNQEELDQLLAETHLNILPTFQQTGIKLKLIYALYASRFCLVNDKMVAKTGLESTCVVANSVTEFRTAINELMDKDFNQEMTNKRLTVLKKFDVQKNVLAIKALLD